MIYHFEFRPRKAFYFRPFYSISNIESISSHLDYLINYVDNFFFKYLEVKHSDITLEEDLIDFLDIPNNLLIQNEDFNEFAITSDMILDFYNSDYYKNRSFFFTPFTLFFFNNNSSLVGKAEFYTALVYLRDLKKIQNTKKGINYHVKNFSHINVCFFSFETNSLVNLIDIL